MPRKVAMIHARISSRKPGDLMAWWNSLTPQQKKAEFHKQRLRTYISGQRGKKAAKQSRIKFNKTPTGKTHKERYRTSEKGIATTRAYDTSQKRKKQKRDYERSPAGKVVAKEYHASEKGQDAHRRYAASPKGQIVDRRYRASYKGELTRERIATKRRRMLSVLHEHLFEDTIKPKARIIRDDQVESLHLATEDLPDLPKIVISKLFGLGLDSVPHEELATEMGLTVDDIKKIEFRALHTLRHALVA